MDKKEMFKRIVKKYWWVSIIILFLLCFPVIINFLYCYTAPCKYWESPSEWSNFWSTYIAAIASLGMIVITARSIILNKFESENNRKLQVAVLNYQYVKQHVIDSNSKFLDYLKSLDIGFITSLPSLVWPPVKRDTILPEMDRIISDTNLSNYRLELSLSLLKSQNATDFTNYVLWFQESISALHDDIKWLLTLSIPSECRNQFDSYDPIAISDFFKESAAKYRDSAVTKTNNIIRIWEIIELLDFSVIEESELERIIIGKLVASLSFNDLKQEGKVFFEKELNDLENNLTAYVSSTK